MNPRIKELAEQAGMVNILDEHAHEYGNGTFEDTPYPQMDKFVELIVRECVFISRTSTDGFSAGRRMEEHFGVEE